MIAGVFVVVFLSTFLVQRYHYDNNDVDAVSLAGFDPGYIISDYQMSNYSSMSETDIQRFLTSKNSCSNTDYNYYRSLSSNSRYTWHWRDGHFVCLSEERFGDGETIGSGETAARIIWRAAQDYRINPQVLIVLLQKETGLITDPIPNNGDYRKATGYGCPDTAPCASEYYGFKNQVRKAAAMFRAVLDGGWTNYPLGNNYIQYNPNASCGGSVVNIRSLATSALYRYTPYQPNAGALAAGYGTAYCGAYGNRNFYLYFEDWFGGITGEEIVINNNKPMMDLGVAAEKIKKAYVTTLGKKIGEIGMNETTGIVFQSYENGFIVGHEMTGFFESRGKIRDVWAKSGYESGSLGFPTSPIYTNSNTGITFQSYEHGAIVGNDKLGYFESRGKIRDVWAKSGYESGSLGFPTSDIRWVGKYLVQNYQHGRIEYDIVTNTAWHLL